jgi:pantoate--beta-alanine ligase
MELFATRAEINKRTISSINKGITIGFVPTMGALHDGHLSLVKRAKSENKIVVASIFVNPTQFNNADDLKNYPRNLEADLEKLKSAGCDWVFAPSTQEMYPEKDERIFDFGQTDKVMEGKFRVGHFNGVAQVVSKLFETIPAHRAYFGMKDFQQVAVIKKLVAMLNIPIEIVPCDIIRETDGLAMSSRNLLLTAEHRNVAPLIAQTLNEAKCRKSTTNVRELENWVISTINAEPLLNVEYFDIVDDTNLQAINEWREGQTAVGCIAVFAGKIRLIDNIVFD